MVTAAAHEPLVDFGRKNLFGPLGIGNVVWPPDDQGRTHGWGDSHFVPRDFAKIGYLYLHGGMWDGKQIDLSFLVDSTASTGWAPTARKRCWQGRVGSGPPIAISCSI